MGQISKPAQTAPFFPYFPHSPLGQLVFPVRVAYDQPSVAHDRHRFHPGVFTEAT
jgi:hypothetical protein